MKFGEIFLVRLKLIYTRPKYVGHGYVFSMAVGTIGEWLKLVPCFVRGRTVDSKGGGGAGSFLAVKHLIRINIHVFGPGSLRK